MTRPAILAVCIAVAMIAPAAAQTDAGSIDTRAAVAAGLARSGSNLDTPDRAALARFEQARALVDPRDPVPTAMMGQIAYAARDTGGKNAAAYFASNPLAISATSEQDALLAPRAEQSRVAALGAIAGSSAAAMRETADLAALKKRTSIAPRQQRDTALDHARRFEANNAATAPANPASAARAHRRYK